MAHFRLSGSSRPRYGLRDTALAAPVHLAVATGLRRGELLALSWADVDFEKRRITVRRSLEQVRAGVSAFKSPKTKSGRRVVGFGAELVEALRSHRTAQGALRLATGGSYNPEDLVFPFPATGLRWDPAGFSGTFGRVARRLGAKVTFRGLRHTNATIALRGGVPMKLISESLGYATVGITSDLYVHVLDDMKDAVGDAVGAALSAARRKAR